MDKKGKGIEIVIGGLVSTLAIAILLKLNGMTLQEPQMLLDAIARKDPKLAKQLEDKKNDVGFLNLNANIKLDYVIAFGKLYKQEIEQISALYDLPPELVLAVFYPELNAQNRITELGDKIATYIPGWNPSISLTQVRIETAMNLAKQFGRKRSKEDVIAELTTPEGAMEYTAMYLRDMIDRKKMGSAKDMLTSPDRLLKLYAHYVGGENPNIDAQLSGIGILRPFESREFLQIFGRLSRDEQDCLIFATESLRTQMETNILRLEDILSRATPETEKRVNDEIAGILSEIKTGSATAAEEIKLCTERKDRDAKKVSDAKRDKDNNVNAALFLAQERKTRAGTATALNIFAGEKRPKLIVGGR